MWQPAWRSGAVRGMVGPRVIGTACGPLSAIGVGSRARTCGSTDALTAAWVRANGKGRVRGRAGLGLALLARIRVRVLLLRTPRSVWRVRHHIVTRRLPAKQTRQLCSSVFSMSLDIRIAKREPYLGHSLRNIWD